MALLAAPRGGGSCADSSRLRRNCVLPLPLQCVSRWPRVAHKNHVQVYIYLSPVTSVTYPVGIPPFNKVSSVGSRVLIVHHFDKSSLVRGPGINGRSGSRLLSGCSSSGREGVSNPTSWCRAFITWLARRRTSAGGTWARLAISRVSSEMRSTVLTLARSRGGRMWVYDLMEKLGRTDRRSMEGRHG